MGVPSELFDRLRRAATDAGDAVACADGRTTLTYAALYSAACGAAHHLAAAHARPGVVLLRASNECGFFPWFLGALQAGLSVMPLSRALPAAEVAALQDALHALAVLDAADPAPSASAPPGGASGDLLLATSGSTDRPKIVVRSAASLDAVARNTVEAIGIAAGDRVLAAVSLAHSYGLEHGLLAPLWAGASVRLIDGMNVAPLAAALGDGIDFLPAVPAMIEGLANLPHAPRRPRVAYSAGAPLPRPTAERFADRLGVACGQVYGMTEIGSVTYSDATAADFDPASVGRPMRGVRLRLNDPDDATGEGELAVLAPSMLSRYFTEPLAPGDGFFATGDLARVDAIGRLTITGRTGLLIETAGRKVNPLEIEAVLTAHPAVAACLVVAMRQTETVQRLRALIEPRDPANPPSDDELRAFARQRLAPHKMPRSFEFRSALPRTSTGKLLRTGGENA